MSHLQITEGLTENKNNSLLALFLYNNGLVKRIIIPNPDDLLHEFSDEKSY